MPQSDFSASLQLHFGLYPTVEGSMAFWLSFSDILQIFLGEWSCRQWRSQSKILEGLKCLTLGEQQYFCLGRRFSKYRMTGYGKNFEGTWPPGYVHACWALASASVLYFFIVLRQDLSANLKPLCFSFILSY